MESTPEPRPSYQSVRSLNFRRNNVQHQAAEVAEVPLLNSSTPTSELHASSQAPASALRRSSYFPGMTNTKNLAFPHVDVNNLSTEGKFLAPQEIKTAAQKGTHRIDEYVNAHQSHVEICEIDRLLVDAQLKLTPLRASLSLKLEGLIGVLFLYVVYAF